MTVEQMLEKALAVLKVRGLKVETRMCWYEGRHPVEEINSTAWNESHRKTVGGIIDNQCRLVIDTLADDVVPTGVSTDATDAYTQGLALWVSGRFNEEGHVLAHTAKQAEAAGEQTVVLVDYDSEGDVSFYEVDPQACHVQLDRAGAYLWAVHFWHEDAIDATTQATVYLPTETIHLSSPTLATFGSLPLASDFTEVSRTANPFGELMLAVVDKRGSVIDDISPLNAALNKLMQVQAVAAENYVLPLRAWLGFDLYDPNTGEVTKVTPSVNPATGGRDVTVPTVADAEESKREIVQLPSPEPDKYLSDQEALRVAIARLASIPAFLLQVGGSMPASGEALEIAYMPKVSKKVANERYYRPFWNRVARLAIRRHLYKLTGAPMPAPPVKVDFTPDAISTRSTRMADFAAARTAGMSLADALVMFLGIARDVAETIEAHADEAAAKAADVAAGAFNRGAA